MFKTPTEVSDLQFWLEIGGSNAGRWQYPAFHEQLLPQFSQIYESVRYSLLALSTCIRQWHLFDKNSRDESLARGNRYYSLACKQLLAIGDDKASLEAALVCSLALFFYDSFTDHMYRRYVHSNAAISLLRLLKRGLSYNEVSGWRSDCGKAGAQIVIEAAEAYLDDISFAISKEYSGRAGPKADADSPQRTKLYDPIWLQLNEDSAALANDGIPVKPEPIRSPASTWSLIQATPADMQEIHVYLTLWHNWLFTWLINTSIPADELRVGHSLCRQWHVWLFRAMGPGSTEMLSMQNRAFILDEMFQLKLVDVAKEDNVTRADHHLERILELITSNVHLSRQDLSPEDMVHNSRFQRYGARQHLRGLAKVLEYVLRRAESPKTKDRAYAIFSFRNTDG